MSRPIEFRAWNKKTRRMVDCKKTTPLAVHPDLLMAGLDGVFIPFHEDLIIEQYTGLKDKKRTEEFPEGQKIFEEDKVKDGRGVIRVCEWIHGGFVFREDMRNWILANNACEVIGNIHEGE